MYTTPRGKLLCFRSETTSVRKGCRGNLEFTEREQIERLCLNCTIGVCVLLY